MFFQKTDILMNIRYPVAAAVIDKNTSIFLIFDIEIIFNLKKFIWGALEYKSGTVADRGLHPAIYK